MSSTSNSTPFKDCDMSAKRKLEEDSVAQRPSKRSTINISENEPRISGNLDPNSMSSDSKPSLVVDASAVLVVLEDLYCEDYGKFLKYCLL